VPGSGELFDWSALDGTSRHERLILAGGLTPDNVADAVRVVRPWGVDVSTGVEARPGHKDPIKVRNFVKAAKAAADELGARTAPAADGGFGPYDWRSEV
jgi:phosphoribosylanthranilate isomerase